MRIWNSFWDDIDNTIEKSGTSIKDKEIACMNLRKKNVNTNVSMDSENLVSFKPESQNTPNKIFHSE